MCRPPVARCSKILSLCCPARKSSTARARSRTRSPLLMWYAVRQGGPRRWLARPFDTTVDTTQHATRGNDVQPRATQSACLSRFCNIWQRLETHVGGLWLRRARVRAPSVTPQLSAKIRSPALGPCPLDTTQTPPSKHGGQPVPDAANFELGSLEGKVP